MSKQPRKLHMPTDEEDAAITAGALNDTDNPPLSDEDLDVFYKSAKRGVGRPLGSGTKEKVTMSLDADLVAMLRATGPGWQTRANDALRRYATRHRARS